MSESCRCKLIACIASARLFVSHAPALQRRRNGGRHKKTTIVALARKLLVALWKYVIVGAVIEGAVMKAA